MLDIFTALIGVGAICAIARMLIKPRKVWDEYDWAVEEMEVPVDYNELRKQKPHIWMD